MVVITPEMFEEAMCALDVNLADVKRIGVAVSGGPDSMALCGLLAVWAKGREVHALIVDHGLRAESASEARAVAGMLAAFENVHPVVLQWSGEKPGAAVQEEARKARYALMAAYCREQGIAHLFLGHHRDDQAETVLFRLAKGSGLDGLAGMQGVQAYDEGLTLLRPFLWFSKEELVVTCGEMGVDYVRDPSNENAAFARVRLRQSAEILAEEGLSAKRLAITAKRLSRARKALDIVADKAYKQALLDFNTDCIVLKYGILVLEPEEIVLRCVLKALLHLRPEADYAPRMEKVETLVYDLISSQNDSQGFRKRTLGGVVFEKDEKAGALILSRE